MSDDQLMQLARDIEQSAAHAEYRQQCSSAGPHGSLRVDREEIQRKFQNCAQPLFEPFTRIPDPASYDGVIDDLRAAMVYLSHGAHFTDPITKETITANRDMQAIETAADHLADWTGEAASAFKDNFLDPFPAVATNQFLILGIMKGAAEADQAVWRRARSDIEEIAIRTGDALDNVGSCGKSELEFGLSVAGAVVAIAGIPFTAGASAAVAAVGATVSVAGAAAKGVEAVKGPGASAEQVVGSMKAAIDKLTGQIRDTQWQIAKTLNAYAGEVDQQKGKDPSPFFSPRPKLAGMEGDRLTSSQGLGHHG